MQATDVTISPTMDAVLGLTSWLVIIFGAVWLVTSVIGYMHRRAYNLTRAESGGKPIKPDFLKVDKKRREAAMDRREEYDEAMERKAAEEAPPASRTVRRLGSWSRTGALITATFTLLAAVVGTLTRLDALQSGVEQLSSWNSFVDTIQKYPVGAVVAVLVIGANIIVFVQSTPAKR